MKLEVKKSLTIERAYELAYRFSDILKNKEINTELDIFKQFLSNNATERQLKTAAEKVNEIAYNFADDIDYNICKAIASCMEYGYSPLALNDIRRFSQKLCDTEE